MSLDNAATLKIPAAQYLRMSKEQQQYSLANQADAIKGYAEEQGFEIGRSCGGKTSASC